MFVLINISFYMSINFKHYFKNNLLSALFLFENFINENSHRIDIITELDSFYFIIQLALIVDVADR